MNDANIRYNFRIQPCKNEEKIYSGGDSSGIIIFWSYPELLNFTKKDTLYIDFDGDVPNESKLTFNEDKLDLSCEKRENKLLRCTVPKNHFEGKKKWILFHQTY